MFPYPILSDNSEAQHSSISIYIPSAGRSFMLEFLLWSSKKHLVWCLPNSKVFLVICCSDFVFQERLSIWLILRRDQFIFENHGSWSDMLDALASWWIFSNNRRLPFRSRPVDHWTFWSYLIVVGRLCLLFAFALFWLEIRLITIVYLFIW